MSKDKVAFKDSGVPWLGVIPVHWAVKRLRYLLARNDGGVWGEDEDENGIVVLRSTDQTVNGEWNVVDPAKRRLTLREATDGRLEENDLVVTKSSGSHLHIGKTCIVSAELAEAKACFSNFMQRLRLTHELLPRLAWYLLNSELGRQQLVYNSNTTTGLANLNGTVLGDVFLAIPPLLEQRAITDFLDERCSRIDGLIGRKQTLVALLKERRQAMVARAVTRGLGSRVQLKDTGIPWLGDVPRQWKVMPLKYAIGPMEQGWSPQCDNYPAEEHEWGVLKAGCVNGTVLNESENKRLPDELEPALSLEVKSGDILMSRANTTDLVGSCVYVESVRSKLILCDKLYRFHALKDISDGRFLVYFLRSRAGRSHMEQHASGASDSMQNIGQEVVRNTLIALPPIHEQKEIVSFLERSTKRIDNLILNVERATVRLQEYRSALISAALTAKVRVHVTSKSPATP